MYICPLLPIISILVAKNKIDVHILLFHIEKKREKKRSAGWRQWKFRPGIEPGGFEPYSNCLPLASAKYPLDLASSRTVKTWLFILNSLSVSMLWLSILKLWLHTQCVIKVTGNIILCMFMYCMDSMSCKSILITCMYHVCQCHSWAVTGFQWL